MKKFTKLLCTLALLFGAVGVASSVKAAQRVWSPSSPWSSYANCKWTAATETFSWDGTHTVVRAIQTGFDGDLSDYENFYITVSDFVGDGVDKLSIKVNCEGGTENIINLTEGENVLAIADMFANPANVTTFELWGPSSSSTECSAKVTNVYLEGPNPWTASEVGAGTYYLYNVGKGQFLTRGNGWGTQASVDANSALTVILEENSSAFKLRTNINGDGKGFERLSDPVIYADQSNGKNSTWTFTKVADASNGPVYTIVSTDNHAGGSGSYMTASTDNTIVGPADAVTDNFGHWQLLQSWITNSVPVNDANGWTVSQTPTFDGSNVCAEYWNKGGASIKQTLKNLPAGSYELTAVALTRDGMTATLNAGTNTMNIVTVGTGTVNNRSQAKEWFNAGNGVNKLEFALAVNTENLEIGLTADNTSGDHWLVWRSFVLIYKGGLDLSEQKAALQTLIDAVPALEGTTTTAAYNAAKNYADGINVEALTTEEAISTASSELAALVDAAKALQTPYASYLVTKADVEALDDDATVYSGEATLDLSAEAEVEAATTVEALAAAVAKLKAAATTFVSSVTVNEGKYFDMTNLWIVNPTVSQNTDGWNKDNVVRAVSWGSGPTTNYGETEFYQSTFDFNQEVTLPRGTFEFGVTGFHRAGNHSTYFYAGDDKILIPGVESTVVNSMAEAKTYFDNGNGKVALQFGLEDASNTIKMGIINSDTETDRWTIFRNFTIHYYGNTVDYSVYAARWDEAVTAANEALDAQAYKYVSGSERTAVTDAIDDAPDGSSKANYIEKIDALDAAVVTFKAAAPSYNAWVLAKTETKNLWGSALGVADPNTAAEAAAGVHELNIAQYNKVATDYPYSLTSKIGDFSTWEGTAEVGTPREAGTPNSLDWEHWSGTTHPYYEQDGGGYGNAGGWTIQYTKTTTLPAGSYVVKVAARSSSAVTSNITITANEESIAPVISLPCVGNRARGIAKDGTASWSDDKEYILENQGGGWEWRFVPFTLNAETTVTMTFYAEASSQYQWMSIGDGELLSTENVATAVAYSDNDEELEITDVDLANVTITRNIKEGYNTVVVPFDLTLGQVEAAFGTGTQVYAFSENSENAKAVTINFNKVNAGTISANVPVLISATAASPTQVFEGVEVVAAETAKVEGTNFDFIGTYAPTTIEALDYFIGNGAIYKSEGNTSIKGFRAYIYNKNKNITGDSQEVKLYIDGIATRISEINGADVEQGATYTIAGQRVQKAQKGLYIVNGKKVLVK